ncbi:hypothetical protein [Phreatobacter sp.]|uniref:hypothetical protein n=1 Tax=Phreatobacter sp. TaxID=1966341 RepID=UPI0025F212D8|nr:hypothetical protein [Phreatobacter sp.]
MWRGLTLLAATELGSAMKRSVATVITSVLAAASLICALGFLVAAGHGVLADSWGATAASLIIAAIFFLLAMVIMLWAGLVRRQRRRHSLATTAMMVAPAMAPPAVRAVASHPVIAAGVIAGIAALGAVLGRQRGKAD